MKKIITLIVITSAMFTTGCVREMRQRDAAKDAIINVFPDAIIYRCTTSPDENTFLVKQNGKVTEFYYYSGQLSSHHEFVEIYN